MSTQTYRDQVTRLVSELAGLETKLAKAREDAARERSAAGRATNSISRTSSPSTVQSRLREAERHEARAVALDKDAARIANVIASKQKARSDAERRLTDAEVADRKKVASEADRRRRDDLRHIGELERARRATRVGASAGLFSTPAFASGIAFGDMDPTSRWLSGPSSSAASEDEPNALQLSKAAVSSTEPNRPGSADVSLGASRPGRRRKRRPGRPPGKRYLTKPMVFRANRELDDDASSGRLRTRTGRVRPYATMQDLADKLDAPLGTLRDFLRAHHLRWQDRSRWPAE